jgi:hypothetical protein
MKIDIRLPPGGKTLLTFRGNLLLLSSTLKVLKMEAAGSSKALITAHTSTRSDCEEDSNHNFYSCEKSHPLVGGTIDKFQRQNSLLFHFLVF